MLRLTRNCRREWRKTFDAGKLHFADIEILPCLESLVIGFWKGTLVLVSEGWFFLDESFDGCNQGYKYLQLLFASCALFGITSLLVTKLGSTLLEVGIIE